MRIAATEWRTIRGIVEVNQPALYADEPAAPQEATP
jgi:hypothetical protein